MNGRIKFFIGYLIKTIFTFGIYSFYFHVTRQQESNDLLREIADNLKK